MNNIKILLITLFVSITLVLSAQFSNFRELPQPYNIPISNVNAISFNDVLKAQTTGDSWIVFVSRQGAKSYKLPNNSNPINTLSFMESFYVKDVVGEYLNIYKPKEDFVIDESDLEEYGWVNYNDVMLWQHCLVTNSKAKVSIKGMVINKVDFLKNKSKTKVTGEANNDLVSFYLDPQLATESGKVSQMFDILYIYKIYPEGATIENAKSVLLGKNAIVGNLRDSKDEILGWVPFSRLTVWDHRVAVEMNSDPEAVEEREVNNTPVIIYSGDDKGKQKAIVYYKDYANKVSLKGYTFKDDGETKRKQGSWVRFPILGYEESDKLYRLGVMGEMLNKQGETIGNRDSIADLWDKLGKLEKNRRNVNIMFVIDGTTSMQEYFEALGLTLRKTLGSIEAANPKNTLKYGAVVYRDAAEGNRLTEVSPLSASKDQLISFLANVNAIDKEDKDIPEAVYYGLKQALLTQLKNDAETNILILIGDAGNHTQSSKTNVDPDFLAKLIAQKNCAFLTYQVHNEGSSYYTDFYEQSQNIALKAAQIVYENNQKFFESIGESYDAPKISKVDNSIRIDNYPYMASITYSEPNTKMSPKKLQTEITNLIAFSQDYLESLLKSINRIIEGGTIDANNTENKSISSTVDEDGGNKYVDSYGPGIIDFVASSGLSNDMLQNLKGERFQLYTEGYAPKQLYGMTYPLFKSTLLLDNKELLQIVMDMEKLMMAGNSSDRRTKIINTWIELLKKYYGNINEVDAKKMSVDEIQEKVFGIKPSGQTLLGKYKLFQMYDAAQVPDDEITKYVRSIKGKYNRLNNIVKAKNDNYQYQFYVQGTTYYWIIEDDLP